jgi:hypothetical protein
VSVTLRGGLTGVAAVLALAAAFVVAAIVIAAVLIAIR